MYSKGSANRNGTTVIHFTYNREFVVVVAVAAALVVTIASKSKAAIAFVSPVT